MWLLKKHKEKDRIQKKILPEGIINLIDIIERGLIPKKISSMQYRYLIFIQRIIADSLAYLEERKAMEIEKMILRTIRASSKTNEEKECIIETNDFIGIFRMDLSNTKTEQQNKLKKSIEKLLDYRQEGDSRILVVFSFNPKLGDLPYETLYYIG